MKQLKKDVLDNPKLVVSSPFSIGKKIQKASGYSISKRNLHNRFGKHKLFFIRCKMTDSHESRIQTKQT